MSFQFAMCLCLAFLVWCYFVKDLNNLDVLSLNDVRSVDVVAVPPAIPLDWPSFVSPLQHFQYFSDAEGALGPGVNGAGRRRFHDTHDCAGMPVATCDLFCHVFTLPLGCLP